METASRYMALSSKSPAERNYGSEMKMQEKNEGFDEWLEKHAASIVDEVLKQANSKQNDGEYRLYKGKTLINTYTCREIATQIAKKKGYTIRHRKQGITQPTEEGDMNG